VATRVASHCGWGARIASIGVRRGECRIRHSPDLTCTAPRERSRCVSARSSASLIRSPARQSMTIRAHSRAPSGPSPAARMTADDLLDCGRIGRVAEAFVPRGSPLVIAGHRGPASGDDRQHPAVPIPCPLLLGLLIGLADRRARRQQVRHRDEKTGLCARDRRRWRRPRPLAAHRPGHPPATFLRVVVLIASDGTQIVIHAMPMRDRYARLLEP
jgi:hypothetical protein